MKLSDMIEGEFFNHYIKSGMLKETRVNSFSSDANLSSGNILMLTQGRPGIDNVFSLVEGIIRLEIDKPTYERTGLEGKPIPSEGRKHVKARFGMYSAHATPNDNNKLLIGSQRSS
jgi:ribonucleases P/MRP protein subunit RPP40